MTPGGPTGPRRLARWSWIVLTGAAACAPMGRLGSGAPEGPSAQDELRSGTLALEVDDFLTAARHLAPLTEGCLEDEPARRAALLLASMELDPANPGGSPDAAADLAARVLRASAPGDMAVAQARVLYRLALDEGASPGDQGDPAACSTDRVPSYPLPKAPEPTTHRLLEARGDTLRAQADSLAARSEALAAQADSLERALARAREAERRARALEVELDRIRTLLRGGTGPSS